ncbi:MAG: type II toxin-antitoxin system RelE family toxin [Stellaceae bacterium]
MLDPYATRNVKALKGGGYRLRVGDYRVLYELKNDILVILVVRIANRREVYRRP